MGDLDMVQDLEVVADVGAAAVPVHEGVVLAGGLCARAPVRRVRLPGASYVSGIARPSLARMMGARA